MTGENKVAVVTGSTGGIGRILCDRLVEEGYALGICGKKPESLQEQALRIRENGGNVISGAFDIFEESSVAAFFSEVESAFGKISLLINLAGLSIPTRTETVTMEAYDAMLDVNVKGIVLAAKYFTAHAAQQGQMINIGSMAAKRANGNAPLYCVSKAAVNMLSDAMQIQLAEKNIRVTTLNPGGADTPFWGNRQVNRAKLLKAGDVADMILFVTALPPSVVVHEIDFEAFAALKQGE